MCCQVVVRNGLFDDPSGLITSNLDTELENKKHLFCAQKANWGFSPVSFKETGNAVGIAGRSPSTLPP